MHGARCDNILPPGRSCRTPMVDVLDAIGRVQWHCPRCAERAAGCCWQCGKRRENTSAAAAYCRQCRRMRDRQSQKVSREQPDQRERVRRYDARKRKRPGYREWNTEHKRAWMARHPEKFAEYAEKARLKWHAKRAADPQWYEAMKAKARARYAERKAKARAADLAENS